MSRDERIRELFLQACDLAGPDRRALLDRECGQEAALRARIEALLNADARAECTGATAGLAEPVHAVVAELLEGSHPPLPERIGPYRILERLGEGGMGVVFRAEQTEPIHREVALKLMRGGINAGGMLARFEAERQALAMIDHPNVARVLDAGTDGNHPYLVMELVPGVPITRYVASARPGVRDRVRIFLDVCQGIAQAHDRGIIHRDLKPSNVLVTLMHRKPMPKVIDFSIAKATDEPMMRTAFRTRTGQVIGTLEYMSPEQAAGRVDAVGTASDVYSLGVLLYEILTERLPIDPAGLPLPEAVRRIAEDPPTSLRGATTSIHADLQTILGKCLEKQPDRRYSHAGELAEDLERYLESRPIRAQPPTVTYQIRKLIGRHRAFFASAAVLLVVLLAFAVTVSIQLAIQSRERARAETALARADRINAFLRDMLSSADPAHLGAETTIREALDQSTRLAEIELSDDPLLLAEVLQTVGDAYRSLGEYDLARSRLERALALRGDRLGMGGALVAETLVSLSHALRMAGDPDGALERAQRALAIDRSIPADDGSAAALDALALAERDLGEHAAAGGHAAEALALRRRSLGPEHPLTGESLITLSQVLLLTDYRAANTEYEEGLKTLRSTLGNSHPRVLETISQLGPSMYRLVGAPGRGIVELSSVIDRMIPLYGEDHLLVAETRLSLADLRLETGIDLPSAERDARQALEVLRSRLGPLHRLVGEALNTLGWARFALGDESEAEKILREAVVVVQGTAYPGTEFAFLNLAQLLIHQGRLEEAEVLVEEGTRRQRQYRPGRIGFSLYARAHLLLARGEYLAAESAFQRLIRFNEEAGGKSTHPSIRLALNALGRCLVLQGRIEEGERLIQEQHDFLMHTTELAPGVRHELRRTAELYERVGDDERGRTYRDAIGRLDRSIRRPLDEVSFRLAVASE